MKTTILLLVAICTFTQVYLVAGNDIDKLLKKLEDAVDKGVAEAKAQLEDAKAKVNEAAQSAENKAQAVMQSTEDGLKKELDALKEKAKQKGVNIDECLGADEQKLVTLPTQGTNSMVSCVAGKINSVIDTAEKALTKIQTIVHEVANIRQEVKDCGHGFHAISCLAKLAEKITKNIISLPQDIQKVAIEAVALIANAKNEVKQCADNALNSMETEGKALLAKIGLCITNKILHH